MYSPTPDEYQKFFSVPPPPPPEPSQPDDQPGTITTGIPVTSTNQSYSQNSQPADKKVKPKTRVPWSSGLCGCFSDWRNCCITLWCPCITFGQIAEIVDKGSSSCGVNGALYTLIACVIGCPCLYSCFYRSKMRQQYMLKAHPCCDCLVHCCCESCALCQEYRELKSQGYNMSIGWHGNMERQNREVAMTTMETAASTEKESMAPVVEKGMSR
ncbi:hypothetical protein L1049_007194 [Liquidambar formosana]|uniref:Uncharacterized protein n=1 Tax=Liquidambar formosana TaxID=63359 RepID=A0AAP0RIE7_LIQFO